MMPLPVWLPGAMFLPGVRGGSLFLVPYSFQQMGGSVFGGVCLYREGFCPGDGVSVQGGLCLGEGVSVRETPRTVKSGRYASYWNAFLF